MIIELGYELGIAMWLCILYNWSKVLCKFHHYMLGRVDSGKERPLVGQSPPFHALKRSNPRRSLLGKVCQGDTIITLKWHHSNQSNLCQIPCGGSLGHVEVVSSWTWSTTREWSTCPYEPKGTKLDEINIKIRHPVSTKTRWDEPMKGEIFGHKRLRS